MGCLAALSPVETDRGSPTPRAGPPVPVQETLPGSEDGPQVPAGPTRPADGALGRV